MQPASADDLTRSDAVTVPGERVSFRNDGSTAVAFRVVRRRDDAGQCDRIELAPDETTTLPVPRGTGAVTVEVHGPETTATTAFRPGRRPPLFAYRDGTTLVVRD
ncbi:hypothetical protein BRC72_06890 [Halobacteriales archaeon QH_7_66_36]|nr:MAG: hypothetical protein BRC72_06890 [Halobacteriales archaeon QH_7_66_36]